MYIISNRLECHPGSFIIPPVQILALDGAYKALLGPCWDVLEYRKKQPVYM